VIGWRFWAVRGGNLLGPVTGVAWRSGEVDARALSGNPSFNAGAHAYADRPSKEEGRAYWPPTHFVADGLVLGRVRLTGKVESRGRILIGERARIVAIDEVIAGRVDLGQLRRSVRGA
jgi:hypothetical protein